MSKILVDTSIFLRRQLLFCSPTQLSLSASGHYRILATDFKESNILFTGKMYIACKTGNLYTYLRSIEGLS